MSALSVSANIEGIEKVITDVFVNRNGLEVTIAEERVECVDGSYITYHTLFDDKGEEVWTGVSRAAVLNLANRWKPRKGRR